MLAGLAGDFFEVVVRKKRTLRGCCHPVAGTKKLAGLAGDFGGFLCGY